MSEIVDSFLLGKEFLFGLLFGLAKLFAFFVPFLLFLLFFGIFGVGFCYFLKSLGIYLSDSDLDHEEEK